MEIEYKPFLLVKIPPEYHGSIIEIRDAFSTITDYYVSIVPVTDKKIKDVSIECINPIFIEDKKAYAGIVDKINEVNKLLQDELERLKPTTN